ncbi:response regulator [bacterium]|nr:response regulator [bacterium]
MSEHNKILILDDETVFTSSMKILFELEGVGEVFAFNSPLKALEYLENNPVDVVVSDFAMPEMNGVEFLSKVKRLYPDLSLILVTGYADKENAIKAINEVGIYRYIEKPWGNDNNNILIPVKNAIERTRLKLALKEKMVLLENANKKLTEYSESLEDLVKAKTADIIEMNSRLNAVINYCADGILLVSEEGKIVSSNPAAEKMFGLCSDMLKTHNISEVIIPENNIPLNSVLNKEEVKFVRDLSIVNAADGKNISVEISSSYISPEKEGENGNFVVVIRDISIMKDMERLRDDFIATLTHDLRTPALAAIQTLEYFLDGSLGALEEKQKMLLTTMKKSNQDMLGLVNTLLEVYKYESGKMTTVKTVFEFEKLVDECAEQVKSLAESKNIEIVKCFNLEKDLKIEADRNEIRRVIMNFMGNAINYTNDGGSIELKASTDGDDLQFSVKDNGIGISKQDIPKLFKRFSQGTSERRSMSTGLGLYLAKQIIDAHGGKIWLESDKGKGSEFFFILSGAVKHDRIVA